jgi:pyrroline-5-carboxylate reductase
MKIGMIGAGRMGRILAARMALEHEVVMYDAAFSGAERVAEDLRLKAVASLDEMNVDAVVLAVPDSAVESCIAKLREGNKPWKVFSVATNISREMLAAMAEEKVPCLNVKIIGHAGEMSRGQNPVVVIDEGAIDMVRMAQQIFASVGTVLVGNADQVKRINSVATEEALKAAVTIERELLSAGITDAELLRGALSQVAPGVLRAYAEDDLGPFARGIVKALHDKPER